jgi:hypothetical protein
MNQPADLHSLSGKSTHVHLRAVPPILPLSTAHNPTSAPLLTAPISHVRYQQWHTPLNASILTAPISHVPQWHFPTKPRVLRRLFALVNEPTIRCPLCVVVVTHQHYPTSYPTYFIYVANEFSAYSPARSSPTLLPFSSRVPTPYTSPRPFTCRCQGPSPYSAKDLHLLLPRTFACSSP